MAKKNKEVNVKELFEEFVVRKEKPMSAISTGSLSLDTSLGVGGIPLRRFTEIFGAEGTGKSTLVLSIAKSAIAEGRRVIYVDAEHGVDLAYANKIVGSEVYDDDKFMLVAPETMEQSLQICETAIRSQQFGLIILDSIASMVAQKVLDDDLNDSNVALLARKLTTFLMRNAYSLDYYDAAFIGVNQVRDKIGSQFPMLDTPGGHEWKHLASVRIKLQKASDIERGDEKVGISTRFTVVKSKVSAPFRSFSIPIIFGKGIDSALDALYFANALGIVVKGGPYYKFEDITLGQGEAKSVEYLENNKLVLDKIRSLCYNIVNNTSILEERTEDEPNE